MAKKGTGGTGEKRAIYYHCDWHASHYVKVMLDVIFGENNFQNEIAGRLAPVDASGEGLAE